MLALQLTPVVISILLLAAHFLRAGGLGLTGLTLLLLVVLVIPRAWAARTIQVVLVLGAVEWARTVIQLASLRAQAGQPVIRMMIILGCVALLTFLSAFLFQGNVLRQRYRLGRSPSTDEE